MTLEQRIAQLETELKDLRAEREKPGRDRFWTKRHNFLLNELGIDAHRYNVTLRTGIPLLIRGTLDCRSIYALSDEGKALAVAMMDDLKAVVLKYYQPRNNPELCHRCRSYERYGD